MGIVRVGTHWLILLTGQIQAGLRNICNQYLQILG